MSTNAPAGASFIHVPQRLVANCDMGQDAPTDVWDWHIYTNPTGKRIPTCGSPGAVCVSTLPAVAAAVHVSAIAATAAAGARMGAPG